MTPRRVARAEHEYALDRRGTAASLRAIDAAHGGGFYTVPEDATRDLERAEAAFRGVNPVVDVQTHLVDPALDGFERRRARRVPQDGRPRTLAGRGRSPHHRRRRVGGSRLRRVGDLGRAAHLHPGRADVNVLTNRQIAATRDVAERYAGTGRVLTHTIVHPNLGESELDAMTDWKAALRPAGWKVYTLWGPPTRASPTGGWFLDDEEVGFPFLERVRALGPRVVATHKGLGGPIPDASVPAASPRDIGPAAKAFPDVTFVVYHSGYERDPVGREGPYDPSSTEPARGVDRLIESLAAAGIGPGGNVYAELGSTWFLVLRRPVEAAHVLGKLLVALGPERIVWGTDCAWYGSPQPLIDAFRAFVIPESMQERHGYPALTAETKERILSTNAQRLYGVSAGPRVDGSWAANAAVELQRAVTLAEPSPA